MNISSGVRVGISIWVSAIFALTLTASAQDISGELEEIRNTYRLPALGAAYISNGQVSPYMRGIRKVGKSTKATVSDKFHLGSDTKALTGTLVALYIERGFFSWTSTLAEIFPECVSTMHPAIQGVTVEMMMAHHSGITGNTSISVPASSVMDQRRYIVQTVTSWEPVNAPGTTYRYANFNYIIAGAILEKIAGVSWETILNNELFVPLAMSSCGHGVAGSQSANPPIQPWPHTSNRVPTWADNPPWLGPAGRVHCSMADWLKFAKLHLDGVNGVAIPIGLGVASFQKMHTAYPGWNYTYGGWALMSDGSLWHAGSNTLNYHQVWVYPSLNLAFVAATNIGGTNARTATSEALAVVKNVFGL